jgi:hypothetical protein
MRPVVSNTVAVHIRKDEKPVPEQPVQDSIRRLAEVKLEPPYLESDITEFLQKHQVCRTRDSTFDDCLFQSVLFTEFFDKIEKGEANPGQWKEHDRPALYLLKKSVDLLQPLGKKVEAACRLYDKTLMNSPPYLRARLEKELKFVHGMAARFLALESDLLSVLSRPQDFRPTRDKACFLLFAHAMLSDAANEVQRWTDGEYGELPNGEAGAGGLVRSYMTDYEPASKLFSSEPLTPADEKLYKKCLTASSRRDDIPRFPVPSFSTRGSQGVLAILHCIFRGKSLLTGASVKASGAHNFFFALLETSALRHDVGHLNVMIDDGVFSGIASKLLSIYEELKDPKDNLTAQDVKRDLFVLFYLLHENTELLKPLKPGVRAPNRDKSFLDCAREFFYSDFFAWDTISALNKLGFAIAPFDKQSSHEKKVACYEEVALAMDSLWKEFRGRHGDDLAASGLFAELPKFLVD